MSKCTIFANHFLLVIVICSCFRNISLHSVQLAKKNVERYYLSIGLVENLPAFFSVLEYLLPSFFDGIGNEYDRKGNTRHSYTFLAICCVKSRFQKNTSFVGVKDKISGYCSYVNYSKQKMPL